MKAKIASIILRRAVVSIFVLFLLVSFVFILLRISPGDPAQKSISPEFSPELAENVRESFGLNQSLIEQYADFMVNIFTGNLGISYNYRSPVTSVIMEYLPFTILLALISLFIQIFFGYLLAKISFKRKMPYLDKLFSSAGLIFYSLPSFVIALILIYIFSVQLNLLPSSSLRSIYFEDLNFFEKLIDYANHLILPLLTLSLYGIVIFYKYLRDNFESVSNSMFVHYLRANGFEESRITSKHIIKNSIGPVIAVAGIELGILFSGALITEVIFSLPGMGRLTVNAIGMRDYPLIVGCVLASGVLIILANFIADVLRAVLDKRVTAEILN